MKRRPVVTFLVFISFIITSFYIPSAVEPVHAATRLLNTQPGSPTLVAPADGATGVSADPTLQVHVTDPENDPLTVTFFGRRKSTASGENFTIVVLPDTQYYTTVIDADFKFYSQTAWAVNNKYSHNIAFVAGVGDITMDGDDDNDDSQWFIADSAYSMLEMGTPDPSDDIPYGAALGNHDVIGGTTRYNNHFGVARFSGRPYYGGHYGSNNNNSYWLFNAQGFSFIMIDLDCGSGTPSSSVLNWADGLLKNNLTRRGIITCHSLINDPDRMNFSSTGTAVFNDLKDNSNLFLMLGGHVGTGHRTDLGTDGHKIYTVIADYSSSETGGDGWMVLLEFQPGSNKIQVRTYSDWLHEYLTDPLGEFILPYTMLNDFIQIGSPVSVPSGSDASVTWPGLAIGTEYEWYAVASDGSLSATSSTWSFTTSSNNSPPVADGQSVTTGEDTALPVTLTATDADGNPLTYIIVNNPSNGTLSGTEANRTYTPNANFNGDDSFTFKANDGHSESNTATVSITVNAVNDLPVCAAKNLSTPEDSTGSTSPSCTDVDDTTLTYSIAGLPLNGIASFSTGKLRYKGNLNYNGPDSFTYVANDGEGDSLPALVSVTVTPVNDPPTCSVVALSTSEDTGGLADPACTDVDGDPMTYSVATQPAHGAASQAGGKLSYIPAADYNGTDTFTYQANDGTVLSTAAKVNVTVSSVEDLPVAPDQALTTVEDTPLPFTLLATDGDKDPLTYTITANPTHGGLSGTAPNLTYTPGANHYGSDSFNYKVTDGKAYSRVATVSITITAVNDPPIAENQSLTTLEDTPHAITLTATDVENEALSYNVVSGPAHGTLGGTAPNLTYTPAANYNSSISGDDSFTFRANDGHVNGNIATVTIHLTPVNDTPSCANTTVSTNEDVTGQASANCTDVDGDTLLITIVVQGEHGTASVVNGTVYYAPAGNFFGTDSFTYHAFDGTIFSNLASAAVTVTAVNDPPACTSLSLSVNEDTHGKVAPICTDVDSPLDSLTYSISTQPGHGAASVVNKELAYDPGANYYGTDSFTYQANDGNASSSKTPVTITVQSVNDAPVANDQNLTTAEDISKVITFTATDVENDPLTYSVVSGPGHGTLSGNGASRTYQPSENYNGPDSFTFKARDGQADSSLATISITITPVNDAPVCSPVDLSTNEDTTGQAAPACTDTEGSPVTYAISSQPLHGSASIVSGKLQYTPGANYYGDDSFSYTARDGTTSSIPAAVSVTVNPINDVPVCSAVNLNTDEEVTGQASPACTDIDGDNLSYTVTAQPSNGTAYVESGKLVYVPVKNFDDSDSFSYKARDGQADSNIASVNVTVRGINDPPACQPVEIAANEDASGSVEPACSDIENDPLEYSIVDPPAHGTAAIVNDRITYQPDADYNGMDSFSYRAKDVTDYGPAAAVTITIEPVNDPPVCAGITLSTNKDLLTWAEPSCTDIDGDSLSYSVASGPAHGSVELINGRLVYHPESGYSGTDTFTYEASDGASSSAPAGASVTVADVNTPPVCQAIDLRTVKDMPIQAWPACSDVNRDPLTYEIVKQPAFGTVAIVDGRLIYTPNPDYIGPDSFTYQARDGADSSNTAGVNVEVNNDERLYMPLMMR